MARVLKSMPHDDLIGAWTLALTLITLSPPTGSMSMVARCGAVRFAEGLSFRRTFWGPRVHLWGLFSQQPKKGEEERVMYDEACARCARIILH